MLPASACAILEHRLCGNYQTDFCSVTPYPGGIIRIILACPAFANDPVSVRVEGVFMLLKWHEPEVFDNFIVVAECYSSEEMTRALFKLS